MISSRATRASGPDSCAGPPVSAIRCRTVRMQRVGVVEGTVPTAETGGADDRTVDVDAGEVDGTLDPMALGQASGDRRSERAAGAVGMSGRDPRAFPHPRTPFRDEHIQ